MSFYLWSVHVVCTYVSVRETIMCEIIWVLKHLNCVLNRTRCWCIKAKDLIFTYLYQQVAMMKLTRFHHLTLRQTNVLPCTQAKVATLRRIETDVLNVRCILLHLFNVPMHTTTTWLYPYILYALEIFISFCRCWSWYINMNAWNIFYDCRHLWLLSRLTVLIY